MKRSAFIVLIIFSLTSACVQPASTARPMTGRNPFTPAASIPLCAAADLQTSSSSNSTAGAITLGVTLVNKSGATCSLQEPPQVTLLSAGQPLDVQTVQSQPDQTASPQTSPIAPVALNIPPGESVILILVWRNYCGEALKDGKIIHLTLTTDENLEIKTDASAIPRCNAQNYPSTLTVNPYSYPP